MKRFALGYVGIMLSAGFACGMLFLYKHFAQDNFVWFGVAVIASYFVGLVIYAVQNILQLSGSTKQ